jgi:hypothetical protein
MADPEIVNGVPLVWIYVRLNENFRVFSKYF